MNFTITLKYSKVRHLYSKNFNSYIFTHPKYLSANTKLQKRNAKIKKLLDKEDKILKKNGEIKEKKTHRNSGLFTSTEYVQSNFKRTCGNLVTKDFPDCYHPVNVEQGWYTWWEEQGVFDPNKDSKNIFSMALPPPNVTGKLHLGHALTVTLQDILCRWKRMNGYNVKWIPGCDHAGISTQTVVEKYLEAENISRKSIGKEKFLKEIWSWKQDKESEIYCQMKKLGASLNWSHNPVFTLDPNYINAVNEAFIQLYNQGLIHRKESLVNWSSYLGTTVSNIEVTHNPLTKPTFLKIPGYEKEIQFGVLHEFIYEIVDPTPNESINIPVATTRIETMLGDTAVAVNPSDKRYNKLIGKFVKHPILLDSLLPIIGDEMVDPKLGTGAVKITPAHDFVDFEVGKRHNLKSKVIFDEAGCITGTGINELDGLKRFTARDKIINMLKEINLYNGQIPHATQVPMCRSGDIIEPRIKEQWFVQTNKLAKNVLQFIENGDVTLLSTSHLTNMKNWLQNAEDWCISRQLWWGHKIPAYYVYNKTENKNNWFIAKSKSDALKQAKKICGDDIKINDLYQDEDVLDTWFSSALYPFASLGWPNNSPDLKTYYPLSVMETGYDLLFFWVARMMMMGSALTQQAPFTKVYLHPMIRDAHGRKMSKSLGNGIDPLDIIVGVSKEELINRVEDSTLPQKDKTIAKKEVNKSYPKGIPQCGTDALRYSLCMFKGTGVDLKFDINNVIGHRQFCNKIWNAVKFLLLNKHLNVSENKVLDLQNLRPIDKWIRSRMQSVDLKYHNALTSYKFGNTADILHNYWLRDICDVYIESCKSCFNGGHKNAENVWLNLEFIIDGALRLLSPFMPYLSEELWQRLPNRDQEHISISTTPFLKCDMSLRLDLEEQFSDVFQIICTLRSLKDMLQIPPRVHPDVTVHTTNAEDLDFLKPFYSLTSELSKCGKIYLNDKLEKNIGIKDTIVLNQKDKLVSIKVCLHLHEDIDINKKIEVIEKRIKNMQKKKPSDKNGEIFLENIKKYENVLKTLNQTKYTN